MLKYIGYIGLLFFMITDSVAQKVIEKTWNAELFSSVEIISDELFSISIISEATQTIRLTSRIEGEFSENIIIEARENRNPQGVLSLSTGYSPYFSMKNDKLAAHKVHAIEMELHIPQNLSVYVRSSLASLEAAGKFKSLRVDLEEGNCLLSGFEGNAFLISKRGNITVYCKNTLVKRAKTTSGRLINKLSDTGDYKLEAESVNGDITLLPSQ